MLDIKFIRQNPDKVKEGAKKKGVDIDIKRLLEIDRERRDLIQAFEEQRSEQNKESVSKITDDKKIKKLKELKNKIKETEEKLKEIEEEYNKLMYQIPNLAEDSVPEGKDENENVVIREVGEKPKFSEFKPKDYLEIAEKLDIIDVKRAAKVSGSRFGYLKGNGALLEFALIQFVFDILIQEKFIPIIPPVFVKPEAMKGMGYIDSEKDKEERYFFEKDNLYLVGTSEQSIGPMHMDEIFDEKELPKRYAAFSTCFRREAGSYGKDTKGILRVHQFDKVEMFSFTKPEESNKEHKFLLSLEEKIMQELKIPYRVVQLCVGDLSRPSASTYDIEAWFPGQALRQGSGQGVYRETHSTSNTTDFQSRRLNIRYKSKNENKYVHTLNGTAIALGRMIIAIIENYQQKDGSVLAPRVLQKYLNGMEFIN